MSLMMPTDHDAYKDEVIKRLQEMSDEELIAAFNREVDQRGWGSSRATFLWALSREFDRRNFDCSAIRNETGTSLVKITLVDNKILKV